MRGKSKSFRDDLSVRSEGGVLRRNVLFSRSRPRSAARDRAGSSSQSVSAASFGGSARSGAGSGGGGGLLGRLRGRAGSRLRRGRGGDSDSDSDSLRSGAPRGDPAGSFDLGSARASAGEGGAGSGRRDGARYGAGVAGGSSTTTVGTWRSSGSRSGLDASGRFGAGSVGGGSAGRSTSGRGRVDASRAVREPPPVPGRVADFQRNFERTPSDGRSLTSSGTGPSLVVADEASRRATRKGRVKEKLERYRRDQEQLKHSCAALEEQLVRTTEKLKEVDSRAASRIESLEGELRESRHDMGHVDGHSANAAGDQGEVIKSLGKKLIRQAYVIKKQKDTVEECKARIDALREAMDAQDKWGHRRAEEYCELKDKYENMLKQKAKIQAMLQENIEGMMDLKSETEREAKITMELKFNFEQKEAALERVTRELSEKVNRLRTLELELEKKERKLEDMTEKLKASETQAETTKTEFEKVGKEVETLRTRCQALEKVNNRGGRVGALLGALKDEQGRNNFAPSAVAKKVRDEGGATTPTSSTDVAEPTPAGSGATAGRPPLLLGWNCARDSAAMDAETFEAKLQAKDIIIQTLDGTVTEHEETIQTLRSDMVKMSSTYKQDSYLKRKEVMRLKQANAEYALKLRALENAFKSTRSGRAALTSETMHGLSPSGRLPMQNGSIHGRLGGLLAPPLRDAPKRESQIVVESNFMDTEVFDRSDRDGRGGEGRKGEFPAEC